MKLEEFDKFQWTSKLTAIYDAREYDIVSVDFKERLVGISDTDDRDDLFWVRCENMEIKQ